MLNYHVYATIREQENDWAPLGFSDVIMNLVAYVFECDAFLILMDSPSFQWELALETQAKFIPLTSKYSEDITNKDFCKSSALRK